MEVSVRELKNRLSEYLRRVQAGEEIVVTSHGRPVGRLVSPISTGADPEADALARLRNKPWVRPGNGEKTGNKGSASKVPPGTIDDLMHWTRGE